MKRTINDLNDVAIIGGGAAGLMCASVVSSMGVGVTVFEKNSSRNKLESDNFFDNAYLGKKLLITGKGRCNLTNMCTKEEFLKNIPVNPKFLYSALNVFGPDDVINFFEKNDCSVKIERGNRVFPISDRSRDVLEALKNSVNKEYCKFINLEVIGIEKCDDNFSVKCSDGNSYFFSRIVVCTGGLSYPLTGSTGDGYKFAQSFGHSITPLRGSLVPIELSGDIHKRVQGLSLKNVVLSMYDAKNKKVYSEMGELLFTHFGISGPLVLSCSAHMRNEPHNYRLEIDFKPALDESVLEARLISDFNKYINRDIDNAMCDLLPQKLISPFVDVCEIDHTVKVNSLKKESRRRIINTLKHFPLSVKCLRPIEEAVITSGGIPVKEINPSTMESKICEGLYFAGEIIDVDGYTGGFNLQIAFSTAYVAAVSVADSLK